MFLLPPQLGFCFLNRLSLFPLSPIITAKTLNGIADMKPSICQWLSNISETTWPINWDVIKGVSITSAGVLPLLRNKHSFPYFHPTAGFVESRSRRGQKEALSDG